MLTIVNEWFGPQLQGGNGCTFLYGSIFQTLGSICTPEAFGQLKAREISIPSLRYYSHLSMCVCVLLQRLWGSLCVTGYLWIP